MRSMLAVVVAVAAILAATTAQPASAASDEGAAGPTIVLVHGAWEQASSWSLVAGQLRARGYRVIAPELTLRTLAGDAASVANILKSITGPVVLVGHSYGGAVISNVDSPNVRALVFIAAFAPDTGESTLGLGARVVGSLIPAALVPVPFVAPGGSPGVDLYINPLLYPSVFEQDVPEPTASQITGSQRPLTLDAFTDPSGAPSWKAIPSWYMVASDDHAIPPATERFMAARAKATTVEIASSHGAHISHAGAVTDLIVAAAGSATPPSPPAAAVASLRVSPSAFRAGRRASVSYALNVAATVRFTVQRSVRGRFAAVRGHVSRARPAGGDRFTFAGRLAGHALAPGRYRLVATPTAGGVKGAPARAPFRIVG